MGVLDHRANLVAKLLVWFSRDEGPFQELGRFFPGGAKFTSHHFAEHWENSPGLVGKWTDDCGKPASFFGTAMQAGSASNLLKSLFTRAFTCPPLISDELDPSVIFQDIMGKLGPGFILGDDIRILKSMPFQQNYSVSSSQAAAELHYYQASPSDLTGAPLLVDVQACIDAYDLGYTVALRGMEFRSPEIAAVTDVLATCLGQATVGANLYLTPPNAQGLTLHYDDHCVLVYQLIGQKHWKIYPPEHMLPRLYSSKRISKDMYNLEHYARRTLLGEGDVLYIPRGYPHEAKTKDEVRKDEGVGLRLAFDDGCGDQSKVKNAKEFKCNPELANAASSMWQCKCMDQLVECDDEKYVTGHYSAHITFGIEVEPPFEWEGLIHMSLYCWSRQQQWDIFFDQNKFTILSMVPAESFGELCTGLLHVAIRNCGDKCSMFRKACLIASKPAQNDASDGSDWQKFGGLKFWNDGGQFQNNSHFFEETFESLIAYINSNADFQVAYGTALGSFNNLDGCLDWMRWLRHLSTNEVTGKCSSWNEPKALFCKLMKQVLAEPLIHEMEDAFAEIKLKFVADCVFLEACQIFESLLDRYRNVRRQFVSGMLALYS